MTAEQFVSEVEEIGFHDNGFVTLQPRHGGHRPGMDALVLAATVPEEADEICCDFGAGNGAAGMAVLQRCPLLRMDFVERDPQTAQLIVMARKCAKNAHLIGRMNPYCDDVTDAKSLSACVGRPYGSYGRIIANPPYNDRSHRPSSNSQRAAAHMMEEGDLEKWVHCANTMLAAKGRFCLILRPSNLAEILTAMTPRFGDVRIKPVHSKPATPANRILVEGIKGSRAALQILPPLTLHMDDGSFTEEAEEIFRGRAGITM